MQIYFPFLKSRRNQKSFQKTFPRFLSNNLFVPIFQKFSEFIFQSVLIFGPNDTVNFLNNSSLSISLLHFKVLISFWYLITIEEIFFKQDKTKIIICFKKLSVMAVVIIEHANCKKRNHQSSPYSLRYQVSCRM